MAAIGTPASIASPSSVSPGWTMCSRKTGSGGEVGVGSGLVVGVGSGLVVGSGLAVGAGKGVAVEGVRVGEGGPAVGVVVHSVSSRSRKRT